MDTLELGKELKPVIERYPIDFLCFYPLSRFPYLSCFPPSLVHILSRKLLRGPLWTVRVVSSFLFFLFSPPFPSFSVLSFLILDEPAHGSFTQSALSPSLVLSVSVSIFYFPCFLFFVFCFLFFGLSYPLLLLLCVSCLCILLLEIYIMRQKRNELVKNVAISMPFPK